MAFFVYVLRSERDGRLYAGMTTDLAERIRQHNAGQTKSLKHRRPFVLVYSERYETRSEAVARELYFKTPDGGVLKRQLLAAAANRDSDAEAPPPQAESMN